MTISIKTAGELTMIRTAGLVARMHHYRQTEPTPEIWEFLRGQRDMTVRELGEWAAEYGRVIVDFTPLDLPAPEPDETKEQGENE